MSRIGEHRSTSPGAAHVVHCCLVAVLAVGFLAGCRKRPDLLKRDESADGVCAQGTKAYTYPVEIPDTGRGGPVMPDDAVKGGCTAPVAAWTDYRDRLPDAGPARNTVHRLRHDAGLTVMCCRE